MILIAGIDDDDDNDYDNDNDYINDAIVTSDMS